MNVLERAEWLSKRNWEVHLGYIKETRFQTLLSESSVQGHVHKRNPKYFAIWSGLKLYRRLRLVECNLLYISDARDMSVAVWARWFSRRRIKVIYAQAMQLGIDKKDLIHTIRFNNLDAWISTLPYLVKQVKDRTNLSHDKLFCIRLGTASSRFEHAPNQQTAREKLNLPSAKFMGVLGRFDRQKGQLEAIEAFSKIEDESVHLLLMGEKTKDEADDYYETLLSMIRGSNLENRVHIRPFNPHVELFFSAIDVFVLPSYNETYGMVTVEAMMCGKKIVASDAGGTIELLENGKWGVLFEPKNTEDLASKLKLASETTEIGAIDTALAAYARREYSWIKETESLEAVLDGLIQNS